MEEVERYTEDGWTGTFVQYGPENYHWFGRFGPCLCQVLIRDVRNPDGFIVQDFMWLVGQTYSACTGLRPGDEIEFSVEVVIVPVDDEVEVS